jgi:hypothetical protein
MTPRNTAMVGVFLLVVGVTVTNPAVDALAGCATHIGGNIISKDKGRVGNTIGNAGTIYVNDIQSTEYGVVRAMIAANDVFENALEWGWSMGPQYNESDPISFTALTLNGSYQGDVEEIPVSRGTTPRFKLQDGDRDTIWRFELNGNKIAHEWDVTWSDGSSFATTERESDCDTGYAHFMNLTNCISGGCDVYWDYLNLGCRVDTLTGTKFDKTNAKEYYTNTGDASC